MPPEEIMVSQAPSWRLASAVPNWMLGLACSALALSAAFLCDGPVEAAVQLQAPGALRALAHYLSLAGEWWSIGIAGLVTGFFFFFRGRRHTAREVLLVTLAGLATGSVGMLVRFFFGRTRPNALIPQGFYGLWYHSHWIAGRYQFSSFVSGHATLVVGLAASAWMVNRRAGVIVGLFAAMVCWSRVAQSSHHFSDVVGACLLALWLAPQLQRRLQNALPP